MSEQILHENLPQGNISSQPNLLENPPQGIGLGPPPEEEGKILAIYPPLADMTFEFYKFYQIRKGQASGTETNMPQVIIDSLPAGTVQEALGFDIRVFDSMGNPLPYESVDINLNPDDSADIEIWFEMGVVKDGEFVQLTFGKPSAIDGSNKNAVWANNFAVVQHMNQQSGNIIDSTSNGNDGTPTGVPENIIGKIGDAKDFRPEVDSYFTVDDTSLHTTNIAVYCWINIRDGDDFHLIASKWFNPADEDWHFSVRDDMVNLFLTNDSNLNAGMHVSLNTDHLVGFVIRDVTTLEMWIDGILLITHAISPKLTSSTSRLQLGDERPFPNSLDGILDEFRMLNTAVSADWMKTVYNNENDNDAYWFKTPLLTNGEDNFLVDDQGRFIVAEGQ